MTWGATENVDEPDEGLPGLRDGRGRAWTAFLLTVVALVVLFAWGARLYPDLPEVIPTHWGAGGDPDAWDERSFGTVFMPLLAAAGTTVMMAFFAWLVPMFAQPAQYPTDWARYRQEGVHRATVSVLGWVSLLTTLLIGTLAVSSWTTPERVSLRWPILLYFLALVITMFQPFRYWRNWADRRVEEAGTGPTPEEAAEDRLWLAGGIYNNPEEPRVMVSKREGHGIGTTINVGNRRGRVIAISFVLVTVVLPVALIFLLG